MKAKPSVSYSSKSNRASILGQSKNKRSIAAPQPVFNASNIPCDSSMLKSSHLAAIQDNKLHLSVNYTTFQFQRLDDLSNVTYERYVGPTPESNWVIPGLLLVGAYPATQDDAETFDLLTSILKYGVTKFVCLQLEYKATGVTEDMWRNGQVFFFFYKVYFLNLNRSRFSKALRPYFDDVSVIVKNKSMFSALSGYNVVTEDRLSFVHFPIKDCDVTDDEKVFDNVLLMPIY
jgi:hypothetical protein